MRETHDTEWDVVHHGPMAAEKPNGKSGDMDGEKWAMAAMAAATAAGKAHKGAVDDARKGIAAELEAVQADMQRMVDDMTGEARRAIGAADRAEQALKDGRALFDAFDRVAKVLEKATTALASFKPDSGRKRVVRDKEGKIMGIEPVKG